MSVTVSDLMKLPSLRRAKVVGGKGGLQNIVSAISVLESTDPDILVKEVFPGDTYAGGEIIITGFVNCLDDVDLQCANMLRLIEGGEVALVLYYVGLYLPKVDKRLIDIANEHDFVLICMPEGQRNLRYSDLISEVSEMIYKDRAEKVTLVSDILARMSSLPHHYQTVATALQMLCAEMNCSIVLSTNTGTVLNLAAWPTGTQDELREEVERILPDFGKEPEISTLLPGATIYPVAIRCDSSESLLLTLIKRGRPLSSELIKQAGDTVRICVNIWGKQHGTIAIHELIRAILQDEPLRMRRLAEIFNVNVADISELWMLCGCNAEAVEARMDDDVALARQCSEIVIGSVFEQHPVMCLSAPRSLKDAEIVLERLLACAQDESPDAVIVRCGFLGNTTECRNAYLLVDDYLEDAKLIFPTKKTFLLGDIQFAASCREQVEKGEAQALRNTTPLTILELGCDYKDLIITACTYLLDCDNSVTKTAEALFIHKNTVKYRLQKISEILGFHLGKMPETIDVYKSAAIYRLLNN